ncbi:MAG: hypothetical protein ACW976_03355 [Candidatus Ranarchaeia archaeon]|jgi:hypothetical protein
MDYRDLLNRKITPVLSPDTIKDTANEFLAKYGGFLETIALMAKPPSGLSYYKSDLMPDDPLNNKWFSGYAKLCTDVGFTTYAVVSALADLEYGQDPEYRTLNPSNQFASDYVCPLRESYWQYLAAIGQEIAKYDVAGIILTNTRFVRYEFCLCSECRKEFREESGLEADFGWKQIQDDPALQEKWFSWKSNKLLEYLKFFTEKVWNKKRDLDIAIKIDLDPEVGFAEGAGQNFGQTPQAFGELTGHALVHPYLFTPILPTQSTSDPDYNKLLTSVEYFKDLQAKQYRTSLYWWGPVGEPELTFMEGLREDTGAEYLFLYPEYPKQYRRWREAHLGIF